MDTLAYIRISRY